MKLLVICRRELAAYFGSVVAYVLLAVFLVLSGYFFYSDLVFFILFGGFTLATGLWQFVFLDMRMVAMLILPLLTMRLFAEEKKLGTMELLWTYPVRDGEIVLGKFLAALLFYLTMLAPTAAGPIVFHHYHAFDVPPVLAGYLGMALLGAAFIACGLFVSSLTENQVVSAMVTYGIIVLFWFITWNEEAATHDVMRWLLGVSLFDRFFNFTRGVIDTRDVVFFVLFTGFFLFLTWQSLATRSWRGVR
jgi:ABC-2 type transport system permease protein